MSLQLTVLFVQGTITDNSCVFWVCMCTLFTNLAFLWTFIFKFTAGCKIFVLYNTKTEKFPFLHFMTTSNWPVDGDRDLTGGGYQSLRKSSHLCTLSYGSVDRNEQKNDFHL